MVASKEYRVIGTRPIRPDGTRGYLNPAPLPPPIPKSPPAPGK